MSQKVQENYEHDDCPECGTPSVPFEGVPDQSFRGCEKCGHEWFEDLTAPPHRAKEPQAT